jgi:hypothetical protein
MIYLQGDLTAATGITSEGFLLYAVIVIASFVAMYFIVQWFWGIGFRNRMMKAQVQLLEEIARKQGVDNETIEYIIIEAFPPKN